MTEIISVENLSKTFPGVQAVKSVSFAVKAGSCFGLLGPNGAGKTTTMEIMEGVQDPSSGTVRYLGAERSQQYFQDIGIQFQATALPDFLTVRDVLTLFRSFYDRQLPVEEIVEMCALAEFLDRDHRKLSGGQRQRMLLGLALVNDPQLIFLDEPTTGLDPQARRNFWQLVQDITKRGKSVILSTHYMDEAHFLCDDLVIMDHGEVIAHDAPRNLLRDHFLKSVIVLAVDAVDRSKLDRFEVVDHKEGVEIHTEDVNGTLAYLLEQGADLKSLTIKSGSLEDLFIKLTGRDLRT